MTSLDRAVVLVAGADGGLGAEFVRQALERGAAKVDATARRPRDRTDDRVVPLALDVTDPDSVARGRRRLRHDVADELTRTVRASLAGPVTS